MTRILDKSVFQTLQVHSTLNIQPFVLTKKGLALSKLYIETYEMCSCCVTVLVLLWINIQTYTFSEQPTKNPCYNQFVSYVWNVFHWGSTSRFECLQDRGRVLYLVKVLIWFIPVITTVQTQLQEMHLLRNFMALALSK